MSEKVTGQSFKIHSEKHCQEGQHVSGKREYAELPCTVFGSKSCTGNRIMGSKPPKALSACSPCKNKKDTLGGGGVTSVGRLMQICQ